LVFLTVALTGCGAGQGADLAGASRCKRWFAIIMQPGRRSPRRCLRTTTRIGS
jgi:hypothetical protein